MNPQLPITLPAFIWHFLKPYKIIASLFIFFAIGAGFWGPFNSMLIKSLINQATDPSPLMIFPGLLIVLNFIIFDNMTWRLLGYLNYKYQPVIKNQITSGTLNFVLGSSHQFFQDNLSGSIAKQITTLADSLELILHRISLDFIRGASLLVVSFITAYFVNSMFFYILFL